MHDIDRTQLDYGYETESEQSSPDKIVLSEADELDLASELLSVNDEADLEQFWGNWARKIGGFVKRHVPAPLLSALKGAARTGLSTAGGALGGWVGGPIGATLGKKLGGMGASAIGLEAESLTPDELEYEGARQLIRFANAAVEKANAAPAHANPVAVARAAVAAAAKQYAPGLLMSVGPGQGRNATHPRAVKSNSGTWVRSGRNIIVRDV